MGIRYEASQKRYHVRIRKRGVEVARSFERKADAQAYHDKITREIIDQGDLGKKQRRTLEDALERFLIDEVPNQRSSAGVKSNIRALLPCIAGLNLDQIDEAAKRVKLLKRQPRNAERIASGKPLTAATTNRRLAVLRRVANLAFNEWHWLDRPIAVRLLPEHNKRHEYLSAEEVDTLAAACAEPVNHMVIIGAYTGMRRGEILQLTKANMRGDNLFLGLTKNGKPKTLPISPKVKPHLAQWIAADKADPRTMYKEYKRGAKSIGRGAITFHDLRHTTASFLLNAGYDLATVAEVLNCTVQNAQRYAHLSMENKRNAMFDISKLESSGVKLTKPERKKG